MSYKVDLIIDNRERDLCLHYSNKVIKENLDLGDIIYRINDKICIIIERKTLSDLSKSIKDGRYKEQKNRIIHSLDNSIRKIYLIEGTDMNNFNLSFSIYQSVIYNTIIRDNIHILNSDGVEDTINIINSIYKRCKKFSEKIYKGIYDKENCDKYESVCHIKKKNNLTKEVCSINQYQQIPGVSKTIAKILYNKFGSLKKLYSIINTEELSDKFVKELSEIKFGKSNRRIGLKTSKKICLFLL